MHDFFLERDYPAATELARVFAALTPNLQPPADLTRRLRMDPDIVANALSKLASQNAASFDIEGNVRATGNTGWRSGYDAQLNFRREQIDRMAAFAESPQCRMSALIQHFGDTADGLRPCGRCDFCAPEASTSAASFREPTKEEQRHLRSILRALDPNGRSTGKLFSDLALPAPYGTDRKSFDTLLDALARAGLLTLATDTFTSRDDGRTISYKKAALTHEGRNPDRGDLPVTLRESTGTTSQKDPRKEPPPGNTPNRARPSKASLKAERERNTATYTPQQQELEAQLRQWRKTEAGKTGKPAFMVFGDSALRAIVIACPRTIPALIGAAGFNESRADRYGAEILAICRAEPSAEAADLRPAHSPSSRPEASPSEAAAERPLYSPHPTLTRQQPEQPLSPAQQALDQRLRAWRAAEADRLNLPHFFVLGASTLRSLVLHRPSTLADLRRIEGIGPEKSNKYGPAILDLLNPTSAQS